jgi:aminotransferase
MISLAGGTPVPVQLKGDAFEPDVDGVKKAITGKTRAILICSPNNPTGTVASGETLSQLAALCREHDLIAISDEIYAELVYEGGHKSIIQQPDMRERTLVLNGLSKSQAMTGWRIGYACGPEDIISAMLKIHQYSMMCASITAQMAGQEALDHGAEIQKKTRREYNRRRQFIISSLNEMGLKCHMPGGAFYAFPSIKSKGLDSEEFCRRLLEEEKVAVVPGSAFGLGGEGHIRCAYAASMDDIRTAMGRMAGFVQRM